MNLEGMKKKFDSGDYIVIKLNDNGYERKWIIQNDFYKGLNGITFKLIHKKHKDVLYSVLADGLTTYYARNKKWYGEFVGDFIEKYNEENEYSLEKITLSYDKPKNNFKDYGFEADFEGEILKEYKDCYIGSVLNDVNNTHMEEKWNKKGISKHHSKWDLKTIKKEWYENSDNFPCLVVYEEKEIKLMRSYSETSKHRKEPCLLTADGGVYHSLSKCRLATKEEVLSLLIKE